MAAAVSSQELSIPSTNIVWSLESLESGVKGLKSCFDELTLDSRLQTLDSLVKAQSRVALLKDAPASHVANFIFQFVLVVMLDNKQAALTQKGFGVRAELT